MTANQEILIIANTWKSGLATIRGMWARLHYRGGAADAAILIFTIEFTVFWVLHKSGCPSTIV